MMQSLSHILYKDTVRGLTFCKVRFRPRAELPDKWCLEGVLKDKLIRDYERRRHYLRVTVLLAIRCNLPRGATSPVQGSQAAADTDEEPLVRGPPSGS